MKPPVILSAVSNQMKTLLIYFGDDARLTDWTDRGNTSIYLNRAEMLALLRALPPGMLREARKDGWSTPARENTERPVIVGPPPYDAGSLGPTVYGEEGMEDVRVDRRQHITGGGGGAPPPKHVMPGTKWIFTKESQGEEP